MWPEYLSCLQTHTRILDLSHIYASHGCYNRTVNVTMHGKTEAIETITFNPLPTIVYFSL